MNGKIMNEIEQAYLEDFRQRDFAELESVRKWGVIEDLAADGTLIWWFVSYGPDDLNSDGSLNSLIIDGVHYYSFSDDPALFCTKEVLDA